MLKRVITAAVGLALLAVVCIFSDTLIFPVMLGIMTLIGVYEMLGCIRIRKSKTVSAAIYAIAVAAVVLTQIIETHSLYFCVLSGIFVAALTLILAASVFSSGKIPVDKVCVAFSTCAYIIAGFISIIMLRYVKDGKYLYLLPFVAPWVSDTFAYFGGRLFGRHKLIPSVSPNKTVEGSACGIAFCIIGCVVYGVILGNVAEIRFRVWTFIVMGIVLAVVSQVGDLIFSLIKRRYDIKDYGIIFPGHGGVLDRFDSVIATAPLLLIICEALIKYDLI